MKKLLVLIAVLAAAIIAPGSAQAQTGVNGICTFQGQYNVPKPIWSATYLGGSWDVGGATVYCPQRHNSDVYEYFQYKFTAWTTLSFDAWLGQDLDPVTSFAGWFDTNHGCQHGASYRIHWSVVNPTTGAVVDYANSSTVLGSNVC